jgi:hypothetical protein
MRCARRARNVGIKRVAVISRQFRKTDPQIPAHTSIDLCVKFVHKKMVGLLILVT